MEFVREAIRNGDPHLRLVGDVLFQTVIASPGSVVAAPAGTPPEPDSFFHLTRDSALVMDALITQMRAHPAAARQVIGARLEEFVSFIGKLQESKAGLGEPRFNADGTMDFLKWSRPQHDGRGRPRPNSSTPGKTGDLRRRRQRRRLDRVQLHEDEPGAGAMPVVVGLVVSPRRA